MKTVYKPSFTIAETLLTVKGTLASDYFNDAFNTNGADFRSATSSSSQTTS